MKKFSLLFIFIFSSIFIFSQNLVEKQKIISESNVKELKNLSVIFDNNFNERKKNALKLAEENGWVIKEDKNGVFIELMDVSKEGKPIYYTTYNVNAANSTRANTLHNGGLLGLNIEGQGMTAHVWDAGLARITHQEYDGIGGTNRFSIGDGTTTLHYHSAHVTGTIIASGFDPAAKGMAPQGYAVGYDWNNDVSEATTAAAAGMMISNHSYGYGASTLPDDMFGQYGQDAVDWDGVMYNAPYYLMVVAAGNDGTDGTSNASPLEGNSGYDKLSGHATAKNNMVVANANDASIDASGNLTSVTINTSSSQGPTDDYRIKPDITGNGTAVYSTYETADNAYNSITGTSMASPNVAGTLLILQQYYNSLYSKFMRAATLKGLALHTADDAGTAGPDAVYGWGLLNAKFAAQTITNQGSGSLIEEFTLADGGSTTFTVSSDGVNDLIVSISWTDPAGALNGALNDPTPALVNDLDLRAVQGVTTYLPYKLTSVTTNTTGDNTVDPYEKIIVTGASGSYDITINHKGALTNGSQNYTVIVTGITNPPPTITSVTPLPNEIYKDRGKQLTINGSGLLGCAFDIGGITGTVVSNSGTVAVVDFPAGNYTNGTLTASSGAGNATATMTILTRTTIPVDAATGANTDTHQTIDAAVDGLHAWLGTSAFTAPYIIDVVTGTYTEGVTLNSQLNPTVTNTLTIQNNGTAPTVNATGYNYGFDLSTVDFVTLKGFIVHDASVDNIYVQGNTCNISMMQSYNAGKSGLKIETGTDANVENNLFYNNGIYGIHVNSSNNTFKNNTLDNNGSLSKPIPQTPLVKSFTGPSDAITDDGCGTNTFSTTIVNVPENVVITNLRVLNMNITHTYDGDLSIYLEHPDATTYIALSTGNGGAGNDYINTNFDDAAATSITAEAAPFTGTYQPEQPLSTFDGMTATGNWTLYVCDGAAADVGTVDSWQLEISYNVNVEDGSSFYVQSGTGNTLENSIIVAKAGNDAYYALKTETGITLTSDYNSYYTTNTNLFDYNGTQDNTGPVGANDLIGDPLFVGAGDYHIFATAGSYAGGEWPPATATTGTWTIDASDSPALDTGNPADAFTNEPAAGGRINQGAYGNTVQASKTSSAVTINWTGAISTDWQTTGNWDSGTIPTSVEDVVIPAGMPNYPIINNGIGTVAVCNNMTIDASASVTIDVNGYMTVNGAITNNAGTTGLIINSDDTGTGSLIQNTSGGVDATVYRRLSSAGSQWHMLASPVAAAPFTVLPSTTYLYEYNESTADYWTGTTYDAGSTIGWLAPSGNMGVAQGYAYNYFATTLTFTGLLNDNTSTSAILVPYTDNGVNAPNGATYDDFDGWNFLGNPYTSAIDWDNAGVAHAAANILDAIYFYDDATANTYASYAGGTGTNGGTQFIPAMQGFFVKGDATEAGGTLNIAPSALIHNAQSFWKNAKETPENFIRLQISGNGYTDETVVRLLDNATNNMDNGLDAYKLFTWNENVPQLYTNSTSSTEYSINSLPLFSENSISIPLKAYQTNGDYTINITEYNFSGINAYIKDNLKNETHQLELGKIIALNSDITDATGRYELIFEKSSSSVNKFNDNFFRIYPNPNDGMFNFVINNASKKYHIEISDISGKIIWLSNSSEPKLQVDLTNQSKGIYFAKIYLTEKKQIITKIIIE